MCKLTKIIQLNYLLDNRFIELYNLLQDIANMSAVVLQIIVLVIGAYAILKFFLTLFWEIIKQLIPASNHLIKYGQNQGYWAVITGGSDGIGLGFCQVLSDIGWNVCIISRNEQKMNKTIQTIKATLLKSGSKVPLFKYIVADFKNSSNPGFFQKIVQELGDINIGILVNNVGTADTKFLQKFTTQQIVNTINVNCASMVALTTLLIPKMKQSKTAIINLSSFLGQNPAPYSSLYSATKAFNTFFSQSISMQKELKKIDILSVRPMFVVSPLSRQKKSFTVPDRKSCATACLKQLRWEYETNGYFVHRVLALIYRQIPKYLIRPLTAHFAGQKMTQYNNQ